MNIEEKVKALIKDILEATEEEQEKVFQILKNQNPKSIMKKNAEEEIANILCELGMPEHVKGYRYVAYAIKIVVENPEAIDAVTSELYPAVAEKFNSTKSRTERAIRHGIECAFDRCDYEVVNKYFGSSISAITGRPTNSEFIARIANIVRRRVGHA